MSGATAWAILAAKGWNPFLRKSVSSSFVRIIVRLGGSERILLQAVTQKCNWTTFGLLKAAKSVKPQR